MAEPITPEQQAAIEANRRRHQDAQDTTDVFRFAMLMAAVAFSMRLIDAKRITVMDVIEDGIGMALGGVVLSFAAALGVMVAKDRSGPRWLTCGFFFFLAAAVFIKMGGEPLIRIAMALGTGSSFDEY